jgi:hypothetical protein
MAGGRNRLFPSLSDGVLAVHSVPIGHQFAAVKWGWEGVKIEKSTGD